MAAQKEGSTFLSLGCSAAKGEVINLQARSQPFPFALRCQISPPSSPLRLLFHPSSPPSPSLPACLPRLFLLPPSPPSPSLLCVSLPHSLYWWPPSETD